MASTPCDTEKTGGKHSKQEGQTVSNDSHSLCNSNQAISTQLLSPAQTSDILQPLSHVAQVPASGYAAALAREAVEEGNPQSNRSDHSNHLKTNLNVNLESESRGFSYGSSQGNASEVSLPPSAQQQTNLRYRTGSIVSFRSANPLASSYTQQAYQLYGPADAAGVSGPSQPIGVAMHHPAPAENLRPSSRPSFPTATQEAQHVQKRSETVQYCGEVDAEGIRFWQRLIIEYS